MSIEIGAHPMAYGAFIVHSTESGRFLPTDRDELMGLIEALATSAGIASFRAFLNAPEGHEITAWYPGTDQWDEE